LLGRRLCRSLDGGTRPGACGAADRLHRGCGSFVACAADERVGGLTVRVFVVAEIPLFRDLLSETLARRADLDVVGAAAGEGSAERLGVNDPDVLLFDVRTPDALDAIRELLAARADLKVVALAVPELEPELMQWVEAGIAGYVTEDAELDDLVHAIRCAARGEAVCSPKMTAALIRRIAVLSSQRKDTKPADALTPREREVMSLLEQGLSNKEIARRLSIQLSTAKHHVHNILEKLGATRRAEAIARVAIVRTRSSEAQGSRPV
jgi:DNA-binding NarL/FixJ family response regulator